MAYLNTTSATGNTFAASAASFFEGIATRIKQRRLYRTTYNELNALSARELDDLGLSRSELHHIAWESAQNAGH